MGDLSKQDVSRAEEILKDKFTPQITWKYKCILVHKVDEYKKKHFKDWQTEDTARYLNINYHYILDSLRLYEGLRLYNNLALVKNRRKAAEILRSKKPFESLEKFLKENNISTLELSVDE